MSKLYELEIIIYFANRGNPMITEQSLKEMAADPKFYFPNTNCKKIWYDEKIKALKGIILTKYNPKNEFIMQWD